MSSRKTLDTAALSERSLPDVIVTQADTMRLLQELEVYEETTNQRLLAKGATGSVKPVRHSESLRSLADELSCDLAKRADRQNLLKFLTFVKTKSPTVNISFAAEPSEAALLKLVAWFRQEIHPHTLLDVNVKPGIIGGCVVRSANKYFDYSFADKLDIADTLLRKRLTMVANQ